MTTNTPADAVDIPGMPGYLIDPRGAVWSLHRYPARQLTLDDSPMRTVYATVATTYGRVRVYDLLRILIGKPQADDWVDMVDDERYRDWADRILDPEDDYDGSDLGDSHPWRARIYEEHAYPIPSHSRDDRLPEVA